MTPKSSLSKSVPAQGVAFSGHVDQVKAGEIRGWIKAVDDDAPLRIDVVVNGVLVAGNAAVGMLRDGPQAAGASEQERHAFVVPFDLSLVAQPERPRELAVEILHHPGGQVLLSQSFAVEAPEPQEGPSSGYVGHIDRCTNGVFSGWIKAVDDDAPLQIDVVVNGVLVAGNASAGMLREDLKSAGIGHGCYAFVVPFDAALVMKSAETRELAVEIRHHPEGQLLLSQSFVVPERRDGLAPGYIGNIDRCENSAFSGWIKAVDEDAPLQIDVVVNGVLVAGNASAGRLRDDLQAAGIGHGCYAFVIPFDRSLAVQSGEQQDLAVEILRHPGGQLLLAQSVAVPELQEGPVMGYIGNIDRCENGVFSGWIKAVDDDTPLQIDVVVNGVLVAGNAPAGMLREDLESAGIGHGRYAFVVPFDLQMVAQSSEMRELAVELRHYPGGQLLLAQSFALPETELREGLASGYIGTIDRCENGVLSGWIKTVEDDTPLRIDVAVNGVLVAKDISASELRADLRRAEYGTGAYGFTVPLNFAPEDGEKVPVELRNARTGRAILKYWHMPEPPQVVSLPIVEAVAVVEPPEPMNCQVKLETIRNGVLRGWAINTDKPAGIFPVEVLINGILLRTVMNDRSRDDLARLGKSSGFGGIQTELPLAALGAGEHEVTLRTPDGKTAVASVTGEEPVVRIPVASELAAGAKIAVVVPVYNAAEDLEICIERLAMFTPPEVDILFIDDCSPDPRIAGILKAATKAHPSMRALKNTKNLGFSGTINRGIKETGAADVIMLNSDARVTPKWIEGLWTAAYSDQRIATATAMSDRAGAFSAPQAGNENPLPPGVDEVTFARAFRRASLGLYPRVPTGNGFCMYVRRACIAEIGQLDHVAFPKGYGEENDFCMRAGRAGWQHVIDDRTYVFHDRSKSFGDSKAELITAGRAIIDARYPDYQKAISVFGNSPTIALARMAGYRASHDLMSGKAPATRVLFVIATQTGGTPQTNADLMRAFDGDIEGWTLRCDSRMLELCRLDGDSIAVVAQHTLEEPVDPLTHHSFEYERVVQGWLIAYDFDLIHIRHLAWHSLRLPAIARRLHMRTVFSFHDFYMLSPTIKMIDDDGVFLGDSFGPEGREKRESLWPRGTQPDPTGPWLEFWRKRNEEALLQCDAFITTSDSARELILRHLPNLPAERFIVIPHGRDFAEFSRLRTPYLRYDEPLRILLPGNINEAKGLHVVFDLLEHDRAGRLEFHVLGNIDLRRHRGHPRLVLHGQYKRDEFASRVAALNVHAGAIFSIWDETYCHTLTELWSVGLPVVVFDMPNVATRVRNSGAGWVMDHSDIPALYEQLLRKLCDPREQAAKVMALSEWQSGYGAANGTRMMAASYLAIYRDLLRDVARVPGSGTRARVAVVCPAEPTLRRANAATAVRVWERCRNSINRDVTFIRMTPEAFVPAVRLGMVDAAIVQRTALPRPLVEPALEAMREKAVPYVLDIDEDLLNLPEDKDPTGIYADYAPALRALLAEARRVTTSTEALREAMLPFAGQVEVVPSRLSDRLWTRLPATRRNDEKGVRAVYIGTGQQDEDLAMILPVLDAVHARAERLQCTLIGVPAAPEILEGREDWLELVEVPPEARDYGQLVPWLLQQAPRFDFGLAPLLDTPFNATSTPLKLLHYAGMGLPVLASDVPVYRAAVVADDPHVTLVENTEKAWDRALSNALKASPRKDTVDEACRQRLRETGMLAETLPAFDAMLVAMRADIN
ncbi:glycosyltransferase [Gemmobacter serpentinus]|uniref:glycosyltransferase n=1 Tax=Gemmobacter serpentinus TaxID=2652247 RepID=UPI00124F1807|nr:glycosyltransferase [Gemmobacter serpentinus]